jgi:hypothetical protein
VGCGEKMKINTILSLGFLFLISLTIIYTAFDRVAQKDLQYNFLNAPSKALISTYDAQYQNITGTYLTDNSYFNVSEVDGSTVDAFYRQSAEDKGLFAQFKKFSTMLFVFPSFAVKAIGIPVPQFVGIIINLFSWLISIGLIIAIYLATKGDVGGKNT